MADSIREVLRRDVQCEGLLECFHDLTAFDVAVFQLLHERREPLTVDDIADRVDRERSTAYRAVQRLLRAGLIRKEQVNYDRGGYYHVYRPRDGEEIASELQRTLNDWYARMGRLIAEFDEKYADAPPTARTAESQSTATRSRP